MTSPILTDAFAHHVWATDRLFDAAGSLTDDQLAHAAPGTYGSILDTLRHLVGSDAWYLHVISEGHVPRIDEESMNLAELRTQMASHGVLWASVIGERTDPAQVVEAHRDDGTTGHAPIGIRLAQVLHHGSDHRSQICTGLTTLGVTPPDIDVWDFGSVDGRVYDD
jgi:uncharacterized damage-inducible protein DinB